MARAKHRVVIDTNLWISFLLAKDFRKLDKMFADDRLVLLFSQEPLDEFVEVARRPKFRKYFTLSDLQNLLLQVRTRAEFVNVTSDIILCRNPKDNFLLSLAADGQATHILTGDKDLLDLQTIGKTVIQPITSYLSAR